MPAAFTSLSDVVLSISTPSRLVRLRRFDARCPSARRQRAAAKRADVAAASDALSAARSTRCQFSIRIAATADRCYCQPAAFRGDAFAFRHLLSLLPSCSA